MGSFNPEYESHLLALGEKMFLPQVQMCGRRRQRRRPDLELGLIAKQTAGDEAWSQKVVGWLRGLAQESRLDVCSEDDPWLSSILRQMFLLKTTAGEGYFSLQSSPHTLEGDDLDTFFRFRKVSMEHGLALRLADVLKAQREMEGELRFCDGKGELDIVTLRPELVMDTDLFLNVLSTASGGKAFQTPCRVKWHSTGKLWLWEMPPWAHAANQAVCVWALACIERHVWQKFWASSQLDPRHPSESQAYTWDQRPPGLSSLRIALHDFWLTLPPSKHEAILENLSELYQSEKNICEKDQKQRKYAYPKPSFASLSHSQHCGNFNGSLAGAFACPAGTYYSAVRARMQCLQNGNAVEEIGRRLRDAGDKGELVDFLMFADVVRAGSIFDRVTRRVLQRVKKALEEKYAEDLILTEVLKPTKPNRPKLTKIGKKRQKNQKHKCGNEAVPPASPATKQTVKEERRQWVRDMVVGWVEAINGKEAEDDSSFQLVSTSRRKPKPCPSLLPSKSINPSKGSSRTSKASKPAPPTASPPPLSIKVVYNSVLQPAISSEFVAAEFPPLKKGGGIREFQRLTEELGEFEKRNCEVVEQQTFTRMRLMSKLREVVTIVFPGAEAELFGSYSTGLALPSSDMDVAVRNLAFHFREELQAAVNSLNSYLMFQPWTVSTQPIVTATVPLVKLQVDPSFFSSQEPHPIKVDLTFETPRSPTEHIGLASSDFVRRWVKSNPHAKSVALFLKQTLVINDLNSAYFGGVSSYALIVWLIAYMRTEHPGDAGELLMGFLQYFGGKFDAKTTGIDLMKGE